MCYKVHVLKPRAGRFQIHPLLAFFTRQCQTPFLPIWQEVSLHLFGEEGARSPQNSISFHKAAGRRRLFKTADKTERELVGKKTFLGKAMSQRGGKEEEKPEEIIEMSLGTRKCYSCSMEIGREEIRGKSKIPQRDRGKKLTARAKANVGAKRALAPLLPNWIFIGSVIFGAL